MAAATKANMPGRLITIEVRRVDPRWLSIYTNAAKPRNQPTSTWVGASPTRGTSPKLSRPIYLISASGNESGNLAVSVVEGRLTGIHSRSLKLDFM